MSFIQPIGDSVALITLAYRLYNKGYQVARQAPSEFKTLVHELRVFNIILWRLQPPNENSGDALGKEIIEWCLEVLRADLDPLVAKYDKLGMYPSV